MRKRFRQHISDRSTPGVPFFAMDVISFHRSGGEESSFCSPNHAHEMPPLSSKSVARVGRICTGLYESEPAGQPSSDSFRMPMQKFNSS